MKSIVLTNGDKAIVDDEDFEILNWSKWHCLEGVYTKYAYRWNPYPEAEMMHRVIMGSNRGENVHHKNDNGLDNRRINLVVASQSQNVARARKQKGQFPTTSKYKGVHFESARGKWKATISKEGEFYFLGRFDNEEDAARAYDKAAMVLFGEFARLNFGIDGTWCRRRGE